MHTTVVDVTPDMAQKWLNNTAGQLQRPRSEARVQKWLAEIESGNWKLTHQGVALDDNEVIVDGQHRLEALRRSGRSLPMQVSYGVATDTFSVIDVGATRTPGDILHLAGFANTKGLAASARILLLVDEMYAAPGRVGSTFWTKRSLITPQMIVELVDGPRGDLILNSHATADRFVRAWGRPGTKTWMAVFLVLLAESATPRDLQLEFVERCLDGMYLKPGDSIAVLRRLVIGDSYGSWNNADKIRNGIACAITAYNDYLLGNRREILRYRTDAPFPRIINYKEAMAKKEADAKQREKEREADLVDA